MNININVPLKYIHINYNSNLVVGRFASKINLLYNNNVAIIDKLVFVKLRKYLYKIIYKYTGISVKKKFYIKYYSKNSNKYFNNVINNMLSYKIYIK